MLIHRLKVLVRSQRGIALPMALLTMLILTALIAAFTMMGASEPVLANNQLQVAQARAVAESGVEQAVWGLNNPANANGIPNPLVAAAAPYDGSVASPVRVNGNQVGVYTVSVTPGAATNERNIIATGWTPTNVGSQTRPRSDGESGCRSAQSRMAIRRHLRPEETISSAVGKSGSSLASRTRRGRVIPRMAAASTESMSCRDTIRPVPRVVSGRVPQRAIPVCSGDQQTWHLELVRGQSQLAYPQ